MLLWMVQTGGEVADVILLTAPHSKLVLQRAWYFSLRHTGVSCD